VATWNFGTVPILFWRTLQLCFLCRCVWVCVWSLWKTCSLCRCGYFPYNAIFRKIKINHKMVRKEQIHIFCKKTVIFKLNFLLIKRQSFGYHF